jgi:hypothetical protein
MAKTFWTIVFILVLVGIGWFYFSKNNNSSIPGQSSSSTSVSNTQSDIASTTDTSDTSLNQDLQNVNSELNGLATDTSNIDQSLQQ